MLIVTSLAPGHKNKDNQKNAVDSWKGDVISVNTGAEIELLCKDYSRVTFLETKKTVFPILSKPLININSLIDIGLNRFESILLINSDIIIKELPVFNQDGVTIFSRYDYDTDMGNSKIFPWGFDAFYIPKTLLHIFPPSVYALGACWFDLAIPLRYIQSNVPVYYPRGKFIFHKKHETQWLQSEWERLGEYFRWEFGFDKNMILGSIATNAMNTIKTKSIQ